eukprot:15010457-Alexandrium_andersonii.AAC.1
MSRRLTSPLRRRRMPDAQGPNLSNRRGAARPPFPFHDPGCPVPSTRCPKPGVPGWTGAGSGSGPGSGSGKAQAQFQALRHSAQCRQCPSRALPFPVVRPCCPGPEARSP